MSRSIQNTVYKKTREQSRVFFAPLIGLSAVIFLFWQSPASAASTHGLVPATVFNGKTWKGLQAMDADWGHMFKVCVVRGIYEGAYSMDPENAYEQYGQWVSFNDLVGALDRFYAEERNLQIPVTYALILVAKNPNGPTPIPTEPPSSSGAAASDSSDSRALVSMEKH